MFDPRIGIMAVTGSNKRNGAIVSPSTSGLKNSCSIGPCGGATLFHGSLSSASIRPRMRGASRRLHATLALVKSASAMPWPDELAIIREDNAFRFGKDMLPPEEGAALWAEFDAEMDRLYAVMNADKEPDPGD